MRSIQECTRVNNSFVGLILNFSRPIKLCEISAQSDHIEFVYDFTLEK